MLRRPLIAGAQTARPPVFRVVQARRTTSAPDWAKARAGIIRTMYAYRRHAALVLTLVAIAAVVLFALGLVLCIDWGGASAPPRDFGQMAVIALGLL